MAYTKTVWEDLPSTNTPINATNLNNIENGIKNNETNITDKTTPVDFTSLVTIRESSVGNVKFYKVGRIVYVQYQGGNATHSTNDILANIPTEYQPSYQVVAPFTVNGVAYGWISIVAKGQTDAGNFYIGAISPSSASGRIYANFAYYLP